MPFAEAGGLSVYYEMSGPAPAPVVVLSHSLGTSVAMWEPQVLALETRFRVLRYDIRGHGRTAVASGPCSIARLGEDVLLLLDALHVERAHFCGLSVGGLIGQWLGAHAGARIDRLVLCNTGARIGTAESWNARIDAVKDGGMKAIAGGVVERWFSPAFRERSPEMAALARGWLEMTPPEGYVAVAAAIRDADFREALSRISAPTLVIAGAHDPATPPGDARFIASSIPGALYLELDAAHISNREAVDAFTAALIDFLGEGPSA